MLFANRVWIGYASLFITGKSKISALNSRFWSVEFSFLVYVEYVHFIHMVSLQTVIVCNEAKL